MLKNKTLLVWTVSLIAIFALAACGGQPATQAATEAPQAQPGPEPTETAILEPTLTSTEISTEEPIEAPTEEPVSTEVSFANDVMPIIQSRCINCHGGDRIEEGLVFFTYEDIMAGSDNGPVIVPGDVANSLLVELVTNQKMPKRGPKLTPPQVQIITDWVAAGAPNN